MRWAAFAWLLLLGAAMAATPLNTLTVEVENVSIRGGNVTVGVFDSQGFVTQTPVLRKVVRAQPGRMMVTFVGIDTGEYAVKVVQDVNRNQSRDKSLLGVVSEPVGWSRAGRKANPDFHNAKFTVVPGDNRIIVRLWQ